MRRRFLQLFLSCITVLALMVSPVYAQTTAPTELNLHFDAMSTIILLVLMGLNIVLLLATRGWVLSGLIGILTIVIVSFTLVDSSVTIIFSPWLQVMVLLVALVCMVTNFSGEF